jgi:hypothetical protein
LIEPHLRLHPGQRGLTPEQAAEVVRFTEAYIRRLLSAEPADEVEATALLRQAYEVAGLTAPRHIQWVDSPFQLIAIWMPEGIWDGVHAEPVMRASIWETIGANALESVWERVYLDVRKRVETSIRGSFPNSLRGRAWNRGNVYDSVNYSVWRCSRESGSRNVGRNLWDKIEYRVTINTLNSADKAWRKSVLASGEASIMAYRDPPDLACYAFFDTYHAPNDLHALARFNALASGYWLGQEVAIIVRRPKILSYDEEGSLHSATGPCIEHQDGWGFYAWHGVEVPENVILAPEELTREDFLGTRNIEVRRVIQERMGQRFVWELEGKYIDGGPRGVLYEVELPGDWERVARYVQVQDASTGNYYFLRVPPTIQTVTEAVAWSFGLSVEEYHPAEET